MSSSSKELKIAPYILLEEFKSDETVITLPLLYEQRKQITAFHFARFWSELDKFYNQMTPEQKEQRKTELELCKSWLNQHGRIRDKNDNPIYLYRNGVKTETKLEWDIHVITIHSGSVDCLRFRIFREGTAGMSFGTETECFDIDREKISKVYHSITQSFKELGLQTSFRVCHGFEYDFFFLKNEMHVKKSIDKAARLAEETTYFLTQTHDFLIPPLAQLCGNYLAGTSFFKPPPSKKGEIGSHLAL